jgi:rubrerythrin
MNVKKERELLVTGLEKLLQKQNKVVDDYRALAEMLEGIPVALLLDWVVIEEEAHHTLLIKIIHSLKQIAQKESENSANGAEMERDTMLCWVGRLRMKEQTIVAACRALKSQACWEKGDLADAFLHAWLWIAKNIRDCC